MKRQPDRKTMKINTITYYGARAYSDDVTVGPKITANWSNGDYGSYSAKHEVKIDLSPEIATQVFALIQTDTARQLRELFPEYTAEEQHAPKPAAEPVKG
jgi:hypothetical protein